MDHSDDDQATSGDVQASAGDDPPPATAPRTPSGSAHQPHGSTADENHPGPQTVLVVGGTGMLRAAVEHLLGDGAHVVAVARRPRRLAAHDRLLPVAADWSRPDEFAAAVRSALGARQPGEALVWVHTPHDETVHSLLADVLRPDAVVVHLWGSASVDPGTAPVPSVYGPSRSYRQVLLGFADDGPRTRWLTDAEISAGAIRALSSPAPRQIVGRIEPWSDHP